MKQDYEEGREKSGEKIGRKTRESRAVVTPLKGGGMVMFSCTAEAADVTEAVLMEARAQRREVDIADIVGAVGARLKELEGK